MNGSDITKLEEVDLYYNGTINGKYRNVVKVGSDLDKQNVKKMMLGNPYTGVTDEEFNQKAKIAGLKPKDIHPQLMMSTRMGRLPSHPVCPHISEWTVHRTG